MHAETVFRFLEDADAYRPGLWDLSTDGVAAHHWLDVLRSSMASIVRRVHAEDPARADAADEAAAWFGERLDEWEADATLRRRRNTVHALVAWREQALETFRVGDPFERIKAAENARCETVYASVVGALDAQADFEAAFDDAIWGVVAGNVFDVAAPDVSRALDEGRGLDALVQEVRRRPLLVDDRRAAAVAFGARLCTPDARIVLFLDNAGMDLILGAVPFARLLARRGAGVRLVANERPALNDTTAEETAGVLANLAARDPVTASLLADGRLGLRSSGLGSTGLDLRHVPEALNDAVTGAHALVLVGQGRGVETTWTARLNVPTLRLATLKSEAVAAKLGGSAFDSIVCYRDRGALASTPHA